PLVLDVPGVVVKASPPPAVQIGDTTEFSSRAVRTHPDATAEELVAKLPGITVDKSRATPRWRPLEGCPSAPTSDARPAILGCNEIEGPLGTHQVGMSPNCGAEKTPWPDFVMPCDS